MTPEQFIQTYYYQALTAAGMPIYDTLPTAKKLPAVMFGAVRCVDKKCCHATVEIVLNIISADTSKSTLYKLSDTVQKTLENITFENEFYSLGFVNFKSSEVQTYRPDASMNSGGEIWQLNVLKYTNYITKQCGERIVQSL